MSYKAGMTNLPSLLTNPHLPPSFTGANPISLKTSALLYFGRITTSPCSLINPHFPLSSIGANPLENDFALEKIGVIIHSPFLFIKPNL